MGSCSDVRIGDMWLLRYGQNIVRMRVTRVTPEGQIVLVEDPPSERVFVRTLVSNYDQLVQLGTPDILVNIEDEPTLPDLPVHESLGEGESQE